MIEHEVDEAEYDQWPEKARAIVRQYSIPLPASKASRIRFKIAKIKWAEVEELKRNVGG